MSSETTTETAKDDVELVRSPNVVYLYNNQEHYIFHDLFGYILGCSPDLIAFLETFRTPMRVSAVNEHFHGRFEPAQIEEFLGIFREFSCLIPVGHNETDNVWKAFAYRARWSLQYTDDDGKTAFYAGHRDGSCSEIPLDAFETALVDAVDGNKTVADLCGEACKELGITTPDAVEKNRPRAIAAIRKLTHVGAQALKLARFPFSVFRNKEESLPPYLKSVAQFDRFDPEHPPVGNGTELAEARRISPLDYYQNTVADGGRQFDEIETTLSHLFREPHPALDGQTYGQRFASVLWDRKILTPQTRSILEVGAGLGVFAAAFLGEFERLLKADGGIPAEGLKYTILDVSPALIEAQKRTLSSVSDFATIDHVFGNAEEFSALTNQFDLILSNEVISDLSVTRVFQGEAESQDTLAAVPELGELISRYQLRFPNPPPEFFVNTGAMRFIENIHRMLRPGGAAILTEFGELDEWPIFSSQLDHPEFSIQFAPLMSVAEGLGMEKEFELLPDFLNMDLKFQTLSTTRPFFVALRHLLAKHGVELKKTAYTREMFDELICGKLDFMRIIRLIFEPIDRRCMGLSPREFKVLSCYKGEDIRA